MQQDQAETVALQALGFLAGDEDRLARFLAMTGVGPEDLKGRIGDPAFLGAVLDHLLGYEPDLMAFAAEAEIDPALVGRARAVLPGQAPEW